ncbi:MAG: DMT family transporter, partial [Acidimicrobiia bacterium]|nr:DMT family transporter [Acidimicrobiia bacterium]
MPPSSQKRHQGLQLALATAVVSGIAISINGYGVRAWAEVGGAASYTTVKNVVAALILTGALAVLTRRRSPEGFKAPNRMSGWLGLAAIGLVGGSVPFLLFFEGLSQAESVNAAFIHKTLVVWVALMAVVLLREKLRPIHIAAIGALVLGQALLAGGFGGVALGNGELMILAATLMWSVEVIIAKKILPQTTSATLGVARMGLGSIVLITYSVYSGSFVGMGSLTGAQIGWVLLTGAVLSLYLASWFAALSRAGAIDVTAVLVLGAVITALIRSGFQGVALPSMVGLALLCAG